VIRTLPIRTLPIRTLVVEDDPLTAEAHAAYLGRLDGFEVAGVVGSLTEALAVIVAGAGGGIDLVLLDLNLPDGRGIDLARRLRAAGIAVDIVAITAVRDIEVVHTAISVGIVQYLIKPFSFATFAAKLATYLDYRRRLESASSSSATQSDVDGMIASLRSPVDLPIPKGLADATLEAVLQQVRGADRALSASEVAEPLRLSRVTARRYLEHLAEAGQVTRSPRYGAPGRPELEYRWAG
jgi:response regulator of citrate/malate metabolism